MNNFRIFLAYRRRALIYPSIDDMIDDMRADYYLPLIPRPRLAAFACRARKARWTRR